MSEPVIQICFTNKPFENQEKSSTLAVSTSRFVPVANTRGEASRWGAGGHPTENGDEAEYRPEEETTQRCLLGSCASRVAVRAEFQGFCALESVEEKELVLGRWF
jgi:hypothetical protein